ncbi:MAG: type I-E CRISPR-associated protein Cse1/CasA [Myxococcota bacterium]
MADGVLHDLIRDPLLSVRSGDETAMTSLPELLEALGRGTNVELEAIQAHHVLPWHAFAVQLAALALHGAGSSDPAQNRQTWEELLLELTGGQREPWCLVVEDLAKPAFLQPPAPEGKWSAFKSRFETPDEIDILVTAKGHDVKTQRILHPRPEHWVHALIIKQTTAGFEGRDNYGIARMNGGFASRSHVAFAPSTRWSDRFRRDVAALLDVRDEVAAAYGYAARDGKALLWLDPWDGKSSLRLSECDPFYIEICRRLRLCDERGRLVARGIPTKAPRVEAKDLNGAVGDPWMPIDRARSVALTVGSAGFGYRLTQALAFGADFVPGAALELRSEDGEEPLFLAGTLVRGQGKTDGYRERIVPIPKKVRRMFARSDARQQLGELAKRRVERAAEVQGRVLKPAVLVLLQGGPEELNRKDERAAPWLQAFDDDVDRVFFPSLWAAAEGDAETAEAAWERQLVDIAQQQLEMAIESAPIPQARRYRAIAAAERVFWGSARKVCANALANSSEEEDPHVARELRN